jgi:hypothetical protein
MINLIQPRAIDHIFFYFLRQTWRFLLFASKFHDTDAATGMMTLKAMTRPELPNQAAESFILISAANYIVPWLPSASSP